MELGVGLSEAMQKILGKGISEMGSHFPQSSYITEKVYPLLQVYLQNKGWNSAELLQCFSELKEASMLPSLSYLQMIASRVTLDSQNRLILRESGKIILPFEHFANAVMLKHMNGPHGLHLGVEGTIRAVMDSYTIGREQFGMEKEFIIEVIQNCPNPACRYYKNQLDMPHSKASFIPELPAKTKMSSKGNSDSKGSGSGGGSLSSLPLPVDLTAAFEASLAAATAQAQQQQMQQRHHQQQQQQQLLHQQQQQQQQEKPSSSQQSFSRQSSSASNSVAGSTSTTASTPTSHNNKLADFLKANLENLDSLSSSNKELLAAHNGAWTTITHHDSHEPPGKRTQSSLTEGKRSGQEKIVRAFAEIMKNMGRMKTCVRPAMCKPYGKQSEALQKTLIDTIQLVQSLRSCLPPPHIAVSSWKNEDKHRVSMESSAGQM
nr:PREDICTED: uncharacterized protein LOC109035939 isoform X1 [Bemisia tabaci]